MLYIPMHSTDSYSTSAQPEVGELRFIARLNRSLLPTGDPESYTDLGTSTVEGSDVVSNTLYPLFIRRTFMRSPALVSAHPSEY